MRPEDFYHYRFRGAPEPGTALPISSLRAPAGPPVRGGGGDFAPAPRRPRVKVKRPVVRGVGRAARAVAAPQPEMPMPVAPAPMAPIAAPVAAPVYGAPAPVAPMAPPKPAFRLPNDTLGRFVRQHYAPEIREAVYRKLLRNEFQVPDRLRGPRRRGRPVIEEGN